MRLKVSRDFFVQFASKTWLSPFSVVKELVEDSYDEDATKVIVTLNPSYVVVEDDVGMDQAALEKFLVVGSIHKQRNPISPKFGRVRTGRYGTGRLSFLALFKSMKVRTKRGDFSTSFMMDEDCIAELATGQAQVKLIDEPPLARNGSEIWLLEPKSAIDVKKIIRELRKLPILREPFFEVLVRIGEFTPWNFEGVMKLEPPQIPGERIPISIEGITGEIIIANRPLSEEERGIAVLHGGHMVTRSLFGFSPSQMNYITGWVRCDWINVRFADKEAVIEDEAYERFRQIVRKFIVSEVLPKATEAKETLSRNEVLAFRTIDKIISMIHIAKSVNGDEENKPSEVQDATLLHKPIDAKIHQTSSEGDKVDDLIKREDNANAKEDQNFMLKPKPDTQFSTHPPSEQLPQATVPNTVTTSKTTSSTPWFYQMEDSKQTIESRMTLTPQAPTLKQSPDAVTSPPSVSSKITSRKATTPKIVRMSRLGLEVIPYGDENDEREYFCDGKKLFINRKHPAYMRELAKGRDFVVRYILRIVASVIASMEHPDSIEALETANRLIADALKHV
ncbi:MAG: ATP-binding protein [Candidatus Bathyarchaeia archaeon]